MNHDIIRPNGERRRVLVTARPRLDRGGQFIGAFSIFRDITERKRVEKKRWARCEQRYRSVVEQASEGIILYDFETKQVIEANPACQKMLGYTAEEMGALNLV